MSFSNWILDIRMTKIIYINCESQHLFLYFFVPKNALEITSQADSQFQNLNVKKTWFHFSNADQKKIQL